MISADHGTTVAGGRGGSDDGILNWARVDGVWRMSDLNDRASVSH